MVGTPGLEHSRTRLMSAGVAVDRDQVLEQLGEDPDSPAAAVIERLEAAVRNYSRAAENWAAKHNDFRVVASRSPDRSIVDACYRGRQVSLMPDLKGASTPKRLRGKG